MDPVTGIQDFYTALMGLCGVKAKRSELKVAFLADFLNVRKPRKLGSHIDRVYSRCFPVLYEVMNRIKTKRFFAQNDPYWASSTKAKPTYVGQLATLLMRLESHVFIDLMSAKMMQRAEHAGMFSVHDSIIVASEMAQFALEELTLCFRNTLIHRPVLVQKKLENPR